MFPKTATRVRDHTPAHLNFRILDRTADNVARYASAGREEIHRRLDQLDAEWDTDRLIMTHACTLGLAGFLLGKLKHRAFYLAPFGMLALLLEYALQGWYPPLRPMRFFGFRTPREIEDERHELLRALEGLGASR